MQPVGSSAPLENYTPVRGPRAPAGPEVPADRAELGGTSEPARIRRPQLAPALPTREESPRPWPPAPTRTSALSALSSRRASQTAAALLPAPLGQTMLSAPYNNEFRAQGEPTPDGWKLPRNPSRTPVRPRDPWAVEPLNEELGPLRLVSGFGRLRALRLQWPEEFQEPAFSAQRAVLQDLLTRLPHDLVVHIVAEGLAVSALPGLLAELEPPRPERLHVHALAPIFAPDVLYHPMTMWARDASVLMRTLDGREVLVLPRSFRGDGQVDAKLNRLVIQGSAAAPARLGQVLPELLVRRSSFYFEGGDLVASRRAVLVGAHTLAANMEELRLSKAQAVEGLSEFFGLPVQVIDPQPEFHLDLGFTFLDDATVAVADPAWAMRLVQGMGDLEPLVSMTREKQVEWKYEAAARALSQAGYQVVRLPGLCGRGLTTPYITYNNVLLEHYAGPVRRVYMPVYGLPVLDEAARQVYRQHGYQVIDMPSARLCTPLWGAIRCATGELRVDDS